MKRTTNRRNFIRNVTLSSVITAALPLTLPSCAENDAYSPKSTFPLVLSTWNNQKANEAALNSLSLKKPIIEAVVDGIMITENDPKDRSVGYGGRPDNAGNVTLDACIMDAKGNAGSVACVSNYKNPIAIARKVMEETPHVILVGFGAEKFAKDSGFEETNLLTEESRKEYEDWLSNKKYKMEINIENHDTIGMIVVDDSGTISGGCSTSGAAYKMPGRVGDSPIIGAGLFIDDEVGGAVSTGQGEEVLKTLGTFLVVEFMRQGNSPQKACKMAIDRLIHKNENFKDFQVAYLAVNKKGEYGGYSIQKGFVYAVTNSQETKILDAPSHIS